VYTERASRAVAEDRRFLFNASFVRQIFHSNGGMEAVSKFYASRQKNDTLNHSVVTSILRLVTYAIFVLTQKGVSYEKAFGTIEKTGLLGQFIRCVPADPESFAGIVTRLQACTQLFKKKLKSRGLERATF
jgi:hypothetical protein